MFSRVNLWQKICDRSGASAVEYALLVALISLFLSVALGSSSAQIQHVFGEVSSALGPSCGGGGGGPLPMGIKGC